MTQPAPPLHPTTGMRRCLLGAALLTALVLPGIGYPQGAMVLDSSGNVGIGTDTPVRQLHLKGTNAVFRMDRPSDAAAFMLVRTDSGGNILKNFVVGTLASAANTGEFVINDLGTSSGGNGNRRMTINNAGNVIFTGTVTSASSIRYKQDVATLAGASEALERLRGVRYVRKDTGRPDVGLIAEEVVDVFPELVERDSHSGAVESVNYQALVAVLIEGFKDQQRELTQVRSDYQTRLDAQAKQLAELREQLAMIEVRLARAGALPEVSQR